jgi:hypothetical protein
LAEGAADSMGARAAGVTGAGAISVGGAGAGEIGAGAMGGGAIGAGAIGAGAIGTGAIGAGGGSGTRRITGAIGVGSTCSPPARAAEPVRRRSERKAAVRVRMDSRVDGAGDGWDRARASFNTASRPGG